MRRKYINYETYLIRSLRDPHEAAGYLNAVLEEGDVELFLMALKTVVKARGGMARLSRSTKRNRVSLYKMLSKKGNPEIHSLDDILHAFGLRIAVQALSTKKKPHHKRSTVKPA